MHIACTYISLGEATEHFRKGRYDRIALSDEMIVCTGAEKLKKEELFQADDTGWKD